MVYKSSGINMAKGILSPRRLPFRHAGPTPAYPVAPGGSRGLVGSCYLRRDAMLALAALCLLLPAASAPADKEPATIYRRACLACHGPAGDGRSAEGTRLPGRNLTDPRWQVRREDQALAATILRGRGAMPSFQAHLSVEDALAVVRTVIRPMGDGKPGSRKKDRPAHSKLSPTAAPVRTSPEPSGRATGPEAARKARP